MDFKSPDIHRTPVYRAKAAYRNMKRRCKGGVSTENAYQDVELLMTMSEWLDWALPKYRQFIRQHPDKSPSVHRLGDSGDYEIGNLQIISASEKRSRLSLGKNMVEMLCPVCQEHFTRERSQTFLGKGQTDRTYQTCSRSCGGKSTHIDSAELEDNFEVVSQYQQ